MTLNADICTEMEKLLEKVSVAVLAHSDATSKLARWIVEQGGQEERDYLHDEAVEFRAMAETAWAQYHEHVAWHKCR